MDKNANKGKIVVSKNGPYLVSGSIPLDKEIMECGADKIPDKWTKGETFPVLENYALCRCGRSQNKPFCDGIHTKIGFECTDASGTKPFLEQAEKNEGPALDLYDAEKLCAHARFCLRAGDAWSLTERSNDPACKATAIQEACDCPSGRLVAYDKETGSPIEPPFEPSISIVEDACKKVSGPVWVKGGIPIETAGGEKYEIRNRVTLCRCGGSKNKPFCDGTHCDIKFSDGDKSLKA